MVSFGSFEPLAPEVLREQYQILRHSDSPNLVTRATNAIVLGHLRFGVVLAGRYGRFDFDDCLGVMVETIFDCCARMRLGAIDAHFPEPNVTGYILSTIRLNLLRKTRPRLKGKKGRIESLQSYELIDPRPELRMLEFEELDRILANCVSKTETNIVQLRAAGFNDTEIGKKLDLSQQKVTLARAEIRKRMES